MEENPLHDAALEPPGRRVGRAAEEGAKVHPERPEVHVVLCPEALLEDAVLVEEEGAAERAAACVM